MDNLNIQLLLTALSQIGTKEVPGPTHNKEVLKYFVGAGFPGIRDDETAWCGAFANWVLATNKVKTSGKLTARSFLNVGTKIDNPKPGDLVIFWREDPASWKGHVGFFIREDKGLVYTLGGNQGNCVCIQAYNKDQVLGFRRVSKDLETL